MLRLILILLPLFCTGCFSTPDAGPDNGLPPDDGTVTVDSEGDEGDIGDLNDGEENDQTDQSDPTDPTDQTQVPEADPTADTDDALPDTDDTVTDADIVLPPFEVYFDDQIRTRVLAALDAAQTSVRFVAFTFSDTGVMSKLNGLHNAGVDVRGVIGTPVEAGTPSFPLKMYEDTGDGIVHEKFFVVDGATVLLSSANIAYNNILNFMVILSDAPELAALLTDEYDELAAGRRGAAKSRPCAEGCSVPDGTLYLTPSSCDAVGDLLAAVPEGSMAWLWMYTLTDAAPMYDELRALPGRSVMLRALLDDWDSGGYPANQTALDDLDAVGIDAAYYGGSMVFHHKFFVTPDILEFGSMNWTYSGCQKNDELYFITEDPLLVAPFFDHVQEL